MDFFKKSIEQNSKRAESIKPVQKVKNKRKASLQNSERPNSSYTNKSKYKAFFISLYLCNLITDIYLVQVPEDIRSRNYLLSLTAPRNTASKFNDH